MSAALIVALVALVLSLVALAAAGGAITELRDNLRRLEALHEGPAEVTELVCVDQGPRGFLCTLPHGHRGKHAAVLPDRREEW